MNRFCFIGAALTLVATAVIAEETVPARRHVVLIVWDGMRPDFATEKYAPNLDKLARAGMRFRDHHSIYPTATDVNGAALATGCYPNRSGICANVEFRPSIDPRQSVDVSDPDSIKRGDEISGGTYLLAPTFPELLRKVGKTVALVGTKSVALLFDRGNDWTVVKMQNRPLTIFAGAPLSAGHRDELTKLLGPFLDDRHATTLQRNDFATRALTEYFWRDGVPDFSLLWLSEPDLSEHNFAAGSPEAIAAIKAVDANLGVVLTALEKSHTRESTDVLLVSDHGFSTIRRSVDVVALLNSAGFHASQEVSDSTKPGDVLVVGNGGTVLFYVRDHDKAVMQRLADWLQHSDFAGVIFTRENLPGTFPLRAAHLHTNGAPDIFVALRWFDEKNQFGVSGMINGDWNRKAGEGTHATLSRYDIQNTFIAAGPDFAPQRHESPRAESADPEKPGTNLDICPTILHIFGVPAAGNPDGHSVIEEIPPGAKENKPQVRTFAVEHKFDDGTWKQSLRVSRDFESEWIEEGNGAFQKN